jgi:hypothetical protein
MPKALALMVALAACDLGPSAQVPPGKLLEMKLANTSDYEFCGPGRLVLASSPEELEQRVRAMLMNADPGPLSASDDVHLYLLFGGSGNSMDDLRGTHVEVRFDEPSRTFWALIRSHTTRDVSGFKGMTDMRYINYCAQAGKLAPGDYAVKVFEVRQIFKTPRDPSPTVVPEKLIRELTFSVR